MGKAWGMDGSQNWKGGRYLSRGYAFVKAPEHPRRDRNGYVAEHRLVIERSLGRYLDPHEKIHHRNGIKDDNRLENLEVIVGPSGIHHGSVVCPSCGAGFLIR